MVDGGGVQSEVDFTADWGGQSTFNHTWAFLSSIHRLPLIQKCLSYLTEIQRKGEKLWAETVSILGAGHKTAIWWLSII